MKITISQFNFWFENEKTNFQKIKNQWIRVPKVLKTKRILKFFIFRFSISLPKLKNERIFWKSFFDFKSKNKFKNFDFHFLKVVLNQYRLKIILAQFRPCIKRSFDFQLNILIENWILTQFLIQFNFQFKIKNRLLNSKSVFDFQF